MNNAAPIDVIANNALYYQQDLRVPMTACTLVFHGGGFQQEPDRCTGLACLVAKTLFRGTPSLTREMISKTFDLLGATVEAFVTETDFIISVSCFSKNFSEVMKMVSTIIATANFPQRELDLVKKHELSLMDAALQDPERILSGANEYILFGRTPMGKFGSRRAISASSREEVQQFFYRARGANVLYATAISDLPKDALQKVLNPLTENRSTDGFTMLPERRFVQSRGYQAVIFNSDDATNDRLFWSHRGINATDDLRFDLNLIIDALGSFEGLLFDQLRNQHGWCYGAYAFLMHATTRPGRIGYYADPAADTSDKLIPELLRLIRMFREHEDFRSRLAGRNETFKNRYPYQLDIKKRLTNEVLRDRFGIPILDKEAYNARIDQVTYSTAINVIDKVFDPLNITMVFYGDADRLSAILSRLEPSVSISYLDKEVLVE